MTIHKNFSYDGEIMDTNVRDSYDARSDDEGPQSEYELFDQIDTNIVSYKDAKYESKEMLQLMSLNEPDDKIPTGLNDVSYQASNVFPEWVLTNPVWRTVSKVNDSGNEISDILNVPNSKRSQEQVSTLIHWLMSVWKIANTMGFKRCGQMFKEFKYSSFEPNENIIVEGERGLTFYLIVSGNTTVHKDGIGIVGQLSKGKSFGEIALTQGKDLRTATVTAATKVEVLSLHKQNYEYFVRDIQEAEKRENFQILTQCKLFKSWPKGKVEKMCNSCLRKIIEPGTHIFRQGDPPEDLYVIVEGSVNIVKELVIVCKNRWPVAVDKWAERTKKTHKPMTLSTLTRGGFFGEVAIIKNQVRSTSAVAVTRTVLISLDKLEFLHLISYGKSNFTTSDTDENMNFDTINKYIGDKEIMSTVHHLRGGPTSQAYVGGMAHNQAEIDKQYLVPKMERPKPKIQPWSKTKTKRTKPRATQAAETLTEQLQRVSHSEDMMMQLKKAATETVDHNNQIRDRVTAMSGEGIKSARQSMVASSPKQRESGFFRARLESARQSGSSIGFSSAKRHSLMGLDNDPLAAAANGGIFGGKVVLRKNSSVRLDMLYDQFYKRLQKEKLQNMDTADGAAFLNDRGYARRGTRSASIFENITNGTTGVNRDMPSSSGSANGSNLLNLGHSHNSTSKLFRSQSSPKFKPVLEDEEGGDDQSDDSSKDSGSKAMSLSKKPFGLVPVDTTGSTGLSPTARRRSTLHQATNSSNNAPSSAPASLRLLRKSIISYRDAMEG